jgi:predicted permease
MAWTDLRYAVRALAGAPMFSLVAIVCLTLGIATNTTMFSVFDAIFLRPLPFKDASRLVSVTARHPETGRRIALSFADARDLTPSIRSFDGLAIYSGRTATLTDGGEPARVSTQSVSANLFEILGVSPQRGRAFAATDDRPSAAAVALISDSLWRQRYQADPSAIGRGVRLDDAPYLIVGVMPPKFRFPSRSDIWIPITTAPGTTLARGVSVLGHLAGGVTLARSRAELAGIVLPARGSTPSRTLVPRAFGDTAVGSEERLITGALMGAATMLLIIGCVNLANLLLARGAARRREIAVRSALGATRGRIVRQLLTESVLLALVSGALALPLAWYGIRWVHDAVPPTDPMGPYYVDWSLDARTLTYSVTIAVLTGIAFGLAPAFDAAGRRLLNPLREGTGAGSGRAQRRVHTVLIVVQMALAIVLLAAASLFVRTYAGLHAVPLGYDTGRLMTLRVYFAGRAYESAEARVRAIDDIARRLDALAGAEAATVTDLVPLDDQGGADAPAMVDGHAFEAGREPTVQYAGVAGRWPETFDVRLVAGRTFTEHELSSDAAVALVNARLATTFWPGEDPIGRRFKLADEPSNPWLTVIGVVPDIRTVKLDESRATPPTAYLPHRLISTRNYGIVVRTRAAPESVIAGVRAAVHAVDPALALFDVYSMEQVRWLSYWMYVLWGTLFAVFGANRARHRRDRRLRRRLLHGVAAHAGDRPAHRARRAPRAGRGSDPAPGRAALSRRHRDRSRRFAGRDAGRRQPADRRVADRFLRDWRWCRPS